MIFAPTTTGSAFDHMSLDSPNFFMNSLICSMFLHNSYIKRISTKCAFLVLCVTGRLLFKWVSVWQDVFLEETRNATQHNSNETSSCKCTRLEITPYACKMTQCTTLHHMRWAAHKRTDRRKKRKKKSKKKSQRHATLTIRLNQQICVFSVLPPICICCASAVTFAGTQIFARDLSNPRWFFQRALGINIHHSSSGLLTYHSVLLEKKKKLKGRYEEDKYDW